MKSTGNSGFLAAVTNGTICDNTQRSKCGRAFLEFVSKKTGLLSYITGGSSSDSREERSRLMQVQRQQREAVQRCQRSSQSQQQNAGVWPASDVSSETEWHNLFTQVFIQAAIKPVINGTTAVYQKFISDGKISISTCLPSRCASLITA